MSRDQFWSRQIMYNDRSQLRKEITVAKENFRDCSVNKDHHLLVTVKK